MKTYYTITVSDVKKCYLPFTLRTKFRSKRRVECVAKTYYAQGRNVVVAMHDRKGMIELWEFEYDPAKKTDCIFKCIEDAK